MPGQKIKTEVLGGISKLGWEFLIASYRSFPPVGPKSGTAKIHVILRDKQNRTISAYYSMSKKMPVYSDAM
jgi:hypothetical protein